MANNRDSLVKRLTTKLSIFKEKPIVINVRDVMETVYETGRVKVEFTDAERRIIGSLVKDVIKPIDECIFEIGYSFDRNMAVCNLILRSGLQFMLDDFKSFPASESETLEEAFKYLTGNQSIETLDKALENWKTSSVPLTEEDLTITENEITRPKDVPSSHTWWY